MWLLYYTTRVWFLFDACGSILVAVILVAVIPVAVILVAVILAVVNFPMICQHMKGMWILTNNLMIINGQWLLETIKQKEIVRTCKRCM